MKRVVFLFLIVSAIQSTDRADATGSIFCSSITSCFAAVQKNSALEAQSFAKALCSNNSINSNCTEEGLPFEWECRSVYATADSKTGSAAWYASGTTYLSAQRNAKKLCSSFGCTHVITACDGAETGESGVLYQELSYDTSKPVSSTGNLLNQQIAFFFTLCITLLLAAAIFGFRNDIINFIVHGRLPYKLPVYGEDIQSLFKFTQRENWYGRIVFGIVVNLAMNHKQLMDVRKYWLGRVIAFDSLRRQRQNQLAKMHFQLAATAKSDPHDKKKFWSRRWATFRTFIRRLFWVFAATLRLLFAFFFIRVTIAKLVRGTIVESKDLALILQAKEAIEESASYLKEYLTTANSFDGHDEVIDA